MEYKSVSYTCEECGAKEAFRFGYVPDWHHSYFPCHTVSEPDRLCKFVKQESKNAA